MNDLQRRVAEVGHILQERANDLAHASRMTEPKDIAHALALVIVGLEDARSLLVSQEREAEKLIEDKAPWE